MNRLQKKCFIGSAGAHFLLFLILLIGPAFLSSKQKPDLLDLQTLDFYPSKIIDGVVASGGNRAAKPPPAVVVAPPPPAPVQQARPEKVEEPDPVKEAPKVTKTDRDAVDLDQPKPHKPRINTTLTTRKIDLSKSKSKPVNTDSQAQERQLADVKRKLARELSDAALSISRNTSGATTITDPGPGGGGPAQASYTALVQTIYENAWQEPKDTATDNAVTKVSVTIGSDGYVSSSRITRPSGDAPVDRSVQRTLDRVKFVAPFPEGIKEKERTYIINFNLRAKRGLA